MNEHEKRRVEQRIVDARARERANNLEFEAEARTEGYQKGLVFGVIGATFFYGVLLVVVLVVKAWLDYLG